MSDFSEGSGWWQASDGLWYPPDLRPHADQPASPPEPGAGPTGGPAAAPGRARGPKPFGGLSGSGEPTHAMPPARPPITVDKPGAGAFAYTGAAAGRTGGPDHSPPPAGAEVAPRGRSRVVLFGGLAVAALLLTAGIAVAMTGRDDGARAGGSGDAVPQPVATGDATSTAPTTVAAPASPGPSQSPAPTTTAPASPTTTAAPTPLEGQLLAAADISPAFQRNPDYRYVPSDFPCGGKDNDLVVPPAATADAQFSKDTQDEEVVQALRSFTTADEAKQSFDLVLKGFGCTTGTANGQPVTLHPAIDVISQYPGVDAARSFEAETGDISVTTVVVVKAGHMVVIQMARPLNAAPSVDVTTVTRKAIAKAA